MLSPTIRSACNYMLERIVRLNAVGQPQLRIMSSCPEAGSLSDADTGYLPREDHCQRIVPIISRHDAASTLSSVLESEILIRCCIRKAFDQSEARLADSPAN